MALDARLARVLGELLDSRPVLINTLSMNYGTQQKYHFDTFYMPPPTTNKMVAAWIALDDVGAENGPLRYVPGSHRIRPYRFSTGKLNVVKGEMRNFTRAWLRLLDGVGIDKGLSFPHRLHPG